MYPYHVSCNTHSVARGVCVRVLGRVHALTVGRHRLGPADVTDALARARARALVRETEIASLQSLSHVH
jgi:hypothetical protein